MPVAKSSKVGAKEWEQTIVASSPVAEPAPPPAPEPVPIQTTITEAPPPPPEPEHDPVPDLEPVVSESAPLEDFTSSNEPVPLTEEDASVPNAWKPYVRREGGATVLREPFMQPQAKAALEKLFRKSGTRLREKRWSASHGEPEGGVEAAVDGLTWTGKYESKSQAWLNGQVAARRKALKGLERVPANIISKRVVFETDGGFVVEVNYRELGQTQTKHFTVPAAGDHAKVLRLVKSGTYQVATVVTAELVNLLARTPPHAGQPAPPGKVRTWPIRNKHTVAALGLPRAQTRRLERFGIRTTDQLRVHPTGVVARQVGVPQAKVHQWQRVCQLLLVQGLTLPYARVLASESVGLDELRRHRPASLAELVNLGIKTHRAKRLKRITKAKAGAWIRSGKKMRRTPQPFPK